MPIIDPMYIYLIEQLNPVQQLITVIMAISLAGIVITTCMLMMYEKRNKENIYNSNIKMYFEYSENHLKDLKDNLNILTLGFFPEKDKLISGLNSSNNNTFTSIEIESTIKPDEEFKEKLKDLIENNKYKHTQIANDLTELKEKFNKLINEYNEYIYMKKIQKISFIIALCCAVLCIFIPSKSTAYKMLLTNYITVENIHKSGEITSDLINTAIEKIADTVIKIEEQNHK